MEQNEKLSRGGSQRDDAFGYCEQYFSEAAWFSLYRLTDIK
jgi:hypothetical protein